MNKIVLFMSATFLMSMLSINVYAKGNCKKGYKYDSKYSICIPANAFTCSSDKRSRVVRDSACSSGKACFFKKNPKEAPFKYCL